MKHFIITTITTDSLNEQDFVLYDNLFGKKWESKIDDSPHKKIINNRTYYAEGEAVKIDTFIKKLEKLKTKGCGYVSLSHHSDHNGYDIEGLEIRLATKEEIIKSEQNNKSRIEKQQKIKDLQNQIRLLQNS